MASSSFSPDDLVVGKTTAGVELRATNLVEAFIFAARFGDLPKLKSLAEKLKDGCHGAFESVTDQDGGNTALHYAAKYGIVDICDYLIKELKMDVNVENEAGANDLMGLFVSSGADVEPNSFILTPLSYASRHGDKEAVEFLLKTNANPNGATDYTSPLIEASRSSMECADLLIKAGADPNMMISGITPLHIAAFARKVEIIQYLLNAGSNPNVFDEMGFTPLEIVARAGNSEATSILFSVTSPIPSISDWSVSGITAYMKSKEVSEKLSVAAKPPFLFAKSKGSDSVKREAYMEAALWYSKAHGYDPSDAKVLSNRSFCFARMGFVNEALSDG